MVVGGCATEGAGVHKVRVHKVTGDKVPWISLPDYIPTAKL